jgi:serine/threonine protein kinase
MAIGPNDATMPLSDKTITLKSKSKGATFHVHDDISDRYKIRRIIGRGGFGTVYLAEDMKIGRLVAIKQLYESLVDNLEIYERFMQEARIAGRLEHPNIIILYNIEEYEGAAYMVMEYLGGGSLSDLMKKEVQMDIRVSIQIMLGILTGLEAAHNIKVVHRDIKPQNILFGFAGTPKITDFGISHLPASAGGTEFLEHEDSGFMGTPVYMAPEQVKEQPIDGRVDIYAAGALFYQMLSGQKILPLHSDLEIEEIKEIITHVKPQPITQLRPDLSLAVCSIIEKMTAKKDSNRYKTATEVKKDLFQALLDINSTSSEEATLTPYPTSLFWSSPAAILEDVLFLLLIDGKISPAERDELNIRIERLGISEAEAMQIEDKVRHNLDLPSLDDLNIYATELRKYVTNASSGNIISEEQMLKLEKLQKLLRIDDEEVETIMAQFKIKGKI